MPLQSEICILWWFIISVLELAQRSFSVNAWTQFSVQFLIYKSQKQLMKSYIT